MLRDQKGITFNGMSESEAEAYLTTTNNYLRTASYRKNYRKHRTGPNEGKYIRLDFSYLTELSTVDMHLRAILLKMCISIEHALKVRLLDYIVSLPNEDGYSIVTRFLNNNERVVGSIDSKIDTIFTGGLIDKYFDVCVVVENTGAAKQRVLNIDCPIWVLVELLNFGELLRLCTFCETNYGMPALEYNILNPVRSLRNACAHNNCLLHCLEPGISNTNPPPEISQYVARIKTIGHEERQKKLTSRPLFEITCLIYMYQKITSQAVCQKGMEELRQFTNGRMKRHLNDFFADNQLVSTSFAYLQKLVDNP